MEIKNKKKEIIFRTDKDTITDAVEEAVKKGADLRGADLRDAELYCADLRDAKLYGADLRGADLRVADLRGADLRGADLRDADLRDADLRGADLRGADLRDADLRGAKLYCADLGDADLRDADLRSADLGGADLRDADLRCAKLYGENLRDAENIPFIPLACPSDGEFTAWKKVDGKLIELRIPADAKRSSATTNKCRCDKAFVVSIVDIKTGDKLTEIVNNNYKETIYRVGDMVYPDSFDENRWNECSHGIHFFVKKDSAINY